MFLQYLRFNSGIFDCETTSLGLEIYLITLHFPSLDDIRLHSEVQCEFLVST